MSFKVPFRYQEDTAKKTIRIDVPKIYYDNYVQIIKNRRLCHNIDYGQYSKTRNKDIIITYNHLTVTCDFNEVLRCFDKAFAGKDHLRKKIRYGKIQVVTVVCALPTDYGYHEDMIYVGLTYPK